MHRQRIDKEHDAGLVEEYVQKAKDSKTRAAMEAADKLKEWFFDKHKCDWQEQTKGRII